MEKIMNQISRRMSERFVLIIYSLYSITMVLLAQKQQWPRWNDIVFVVCMMATWILYMCRFKNHLHRMKLMALLIQVSVILYAMHATDFSDTLPTFMVFVVLQSLMGVADIIFLSMFSSLIIFLGHILILETITNIPVAISQFVNVLLFEFVMYTWIKKTDESNKRLLKTIEELKVVQGSKDDFVANVSHEIRTPINTICGMSDLMLREKLPAQIKDNMQAVQTAGRNLMGVVSDMLDYSELQSGNIELEEEAYNITSTINDVINMTMAKKEKKQIELVVDCDANLPSVLLGDEKKIRRVILNLVDNAIKFTESGGVCLRIGFRRESYGINLLVMVKDTGIGMDAESLENLFTSFSQVDASRKRQEGGLGLGLAICHALVEKMGGAITVKSKPGKGTAIKMVVPQKVLEEKPIASLQYRKNINVAVYIDMEQFKRTEIRDDYTEMIFHMAEQLKGKCHVCRNLAELQRRCEQDTFSHVFTGIAEYKQSPSYFDKLSTQLGLVVVLERSEESLIEDRNILKIYKPFYILTIVSLLNGVLDAKKNVPNLNVQKFVTRDAHVLVVDDNRMNLRVVEQLLNNYRIRVTTAGSGKEALSKIVTVDYDFVFMDHMMPEMDGVETLQNIRHMVGTYYQKVPIVALTANAAAGTREMLMKEGFTDFLEKPIERSSLERVLRRNLPEEKIVPVAEINSFMEDPAKENAQPAEEGELIIEDLDVEKGILYCNGREQYISILRGYCEEWNQSGALADQLFKNQDWKNYTITIHGMKSAMRSVGATKLSEQARLLEYAGKEGRTDYILQHHKDLMDAYHQLFDKLRENKIICPNQQETITDKTQEDLPDTLPLISDDTLERIISQMEDIMYTLDGDRLLELITELEKYRYKGQALQKVLVPIRRKVEASDYVSAVEGIVRWKNGLPG